MGQIVDIAFSEVNITISVLFILLMVYWVLTTLTGIDFDYDLDIDVDVDVEADLDFDARTSIDINDVSNTEVNREDAIRRRGKLNVFQVFLVFFNFVGLPFMFTLTFWVLFWWVISMIGTYFTHSYNNAFGFVFFFGGMVVSLFIAKVFTTPFKKFFKNFNSEGEESLEMLGREGVIYTAISEGKITTLEVHIDGSPIKVYVQAKEGNAIARNSKVRIVNQSKKQNIYIVNKIN